MALSVGERVQARIVELQTNPAEVARKAGLERTFVHDLVSGRKKTVTAEALIALAMALQCAPEDLVGKKGTFSREGVDAIEIVGVIERGVWRAETPKNLGKMTTSADGNPNAKIFLLRGDEGEPIGIRDGTGIVVDMSGKARSGDIAVIEQTRDDLKEFSLRKTAEAEGQLMFLDLNGDANTAIFVSRDDPGSRYRLVGRVQRAVMLFSNAVS